MKTQGFEARFSQNPAPVSLVKPQNPYLAYISHLFSRPYLSLVLIFSNNLICKKAAMKKGHKVNCVLAEARNLIFI